MIIPEEPETDETTEEFQQSIPSVNEVTVTQGPREDLKPNEPNLAEQTDTESPVGDLQPSDISQTTETDLDSQMPFDPNLTDPTEVYVRARAEELEASSLLPVSYDNIPVDIDHITEPSVIEMPEIVHSTPLERTDAPSTIKGIVEEPSLSGDASPDEAADNSGDSMWNLNDRLLAAVRETREICENGKMLTKIITKMEKGKNLKRKEFGTVYLLLREQGQRH